MQFVTSQVPESRTLSSGYPDPRLVCKQNAIQFAGSLIVDDPRKALALANAVLSMAALVGSGILFFAVALDERAGFLLATPPLP